MQHFDYKPHGVCPMNISFDLDGDTVHNEMCIRDSRIIEQE